MDQAGILSESIHFYEKSIGIFPNAHQMCMIGILGNVVFTISLPQTEFLPEVFKH